MTNLEKLREVANLGPNLEYEVLTRGYAPLDLLNREEYWGDLVHSKDFYLKDGDTRLRKVETVLRQIGLGVDEFIELALNRNKRYYTNVITLDLSYKFNQKEKIKKLIVENFGEEVLKEEFEHTTTKNVTTVEQMLNNISAKIDYYYLGAKGLDTESIFFCPEYAEQNVNKIWGKQGTDLFINDMVISDLEIRLEYLYHLLSVEDKEYFHTKVTKASYIKYMTGRRKITSKILDKFIEGFHNEKSVLVSQIRLTHSDNFAKQSQSYQERCKYRYEFIHKVIHEGLGVDAALNMVVFNAEMAKEFEYIKKYDTLKDNHLYNPEVITTLAAVLGIKIDTFFFCDINSLFGLEQLTEQYLTVSALLGYHRTQM